MTATTNEVTVQAQDVAPQPQNPAQEPPTADPQGNTPPAPSDVAEEQPADLDAIMPDPANMTIEGIAVEVRRIKAREFFTIVRIITNGMGPAITSIKFDPTDPDALQSSVTAVLMYAIPNAIDDFGLFLTQIVDPKDPKQQKALDKVMENPEIDTVLDVMMVLVEQEKDDFSVLWGKLRAYFSKTLAGMGQG